MSVLSSSEQEQTELAHIDIDENLTNEDEDGAEGDTFNLDLIKKERARCIIELRTFMLTI